MSNSDIINTAKELAETPLIMLTHGGVSPSIAMASIKPISCLKP